MGVASSCSSAPVLIHLQLLVCQPTVEDYPCLVEARFNPSSLVWYDNDDRGLDT